MNERLGNESEKMLYGVRVRLRVFICFNYYAGAKVLIFTVISTFERRVIPSVFSRMNQIRFGHPEERVPTACRGLMYRALRALCRANRFSFVMARQGPYARRPAVRKRKCRRRRPCAAMRFSSLKHSFI
ncbi:hypothetical protein QZM81_30145 [Burkholderia cepacia]|uniref:hypothetical protein n=1 Tax=Burkholderia cepacia TaxID=292 RepID=UPI0026530DC1|nr:hypothetical protein [Burkholderia cepacia]MDN7860070.1 hypothetical protein [Burkholderia cepacia]